MKPSDGLKFCKKYSPVKLTDWQEEILKGIFSNRFCLIILPSGAGKTLMASLAVGASLICSKKKIRSFAVSNDIEQAGLLDQSLNEVFEHPDLRRLVDATQWKIALKHQPKSVHQTLATHVSSAWGKTPHLVVADELSESTAASEKNFFAVVSALRKTKDSRLIIITSPSFRDSTAHKILEQVRNDPNWFCVEYTSDEISCPWLDESDSIYDVLLPREIRESKHKGIWVDPGGGVMDRAKVDNMTVDAFPHATGRRAGGVDLAYSRDWAALSIVEQIERCYYVKCLHAWIPTRGSKVHLPDIEDEIYALQCHYDCWKWNIDPSQALLMVQRLQAEPRRVPIKEFHFSYESRKQIISRLLDLIEDGRVFVRAHPDLRKQLLSLSVQKTPSGLWKIDHRRNAKDDLVIATALAIAALPESAGGWRPEGHGMRKTAAEKLARQAMDLHMGYRE